MADLATAVPTQVTAGDTLTWLITLDDYPASTGWVLSYAIASPTERHTVTATASGDDHLVTVAATASASWGAGRYTWHAYVTKTTERYTVGTGELTVLPNLATEPGGYDSRSTARVIYDALDAWLRDPSTKPWVSEIEIAGRRIKYADAVEWHSKLKAEVTRDEAAATASMSGVDPRRYFVRFGRA